MMETDRNLTLFKDEAQELLEEMERALLALEDAPHDETLLHRVFRAAHTVKGLAGMVGMDAMVAVTHEVETTFDAIRAGRLSLTHELATLALAAVDHLRTLTQHAGGEPTTTAADSETGGRLAAAFRARAMQAGVTLDEHCMTEDDASAAAGAFATHPEAPSWRFAAPPAGAAGAERQPACFRITLKPRSPETLDDQAGLVDPLDILDSLRALGPCRVRVHPEDVTPLEGLGVPAAEAALAPQLWWDVELCAPDAALPAEDFENAIRDALLFAEETLDVTLAPLDDATPPAPPVRGDFADSADAATSATSATVAASRQDPTAPETAASPLAVQGGEGPGASAPPTSGPPFASCEDRRRADSPTTPIRERRRRAHETLRVEATKLDDLVGLVGELVIAQSRLTQIAEDVGDGGLTGVVEEIDQLVGSLRDATLAMRMLPIGGAFDRFRRLARDLANELGKELQLTTSGEETELDKTVIERLGDPLVHLLRNAIDHGLEPPDERERLGKPRAGTVRLAAEHTAGSVVITIEDDGRGLDRDAIAAKAVERGILTDASRLSDAEVFDVIFHPGFSTAAQVSDVSGRGVGMDVVRRNIEALRGQTLLESEPGRGARVTVRLPLTLAIIDGLEVRVGPERYIIPLSSVEECVELPRASRRRDECILNLRGGIVPYIHLRDWFDAPGEPPAIEQVIITREGGALVGVVVDEVLGQQQTVIKSLGKIYHHLEEISGASVGGDGAMSLILDVAALVKKAQG